MTLTVAQGMLTLAGTAGLTSVAGDGTSSVSFEGTAAEINAALDGLAYQPATDYTGTDLLTMVADDGGNTGLGGALTGTGQVQITVTPVNDEPSLNLAGNQNVNEDSAMITPPTWLVAMTMTGVHTLGRICLRTIRQSLPPEARAVSGLTAYLDYVEQHAGAYTALLRSGIGVNSEVAQIVEATRRSIVSRMLSDIGLETPPPHVRILARAWIGAVEAAALDWLEHRDLQRDELIRMLVALLSTISQVTMEQAT